MTLIFPPFLWSFMRRPWTLPEDGSVTTYVRSINNDTPRTYLTGYVPVTATIVKQTIIIIIVIHSKSDPLVWSGHRSLTRCCDGTEVVANAESIFPLAPKRYRSTTMHIVLYFLSTSTVTKSVVLSFRIEKKNQKKKKESELQREVSKRKTRNVRKIDRS